MEENKKEKISINYGKLIFFLILILGIIYLYNIGFFYKFKRINKENINEIIMSEKLTETERMKILMLQLTEDNIYGKMIWEVLK